MLELLKRLLLKQKHIKTRNNKRSYAAAEISRLVAGWTVASTTADTEIRGSIKVIRARERELAQNNDYARKFLKLCVVNVVGPNGIGMQNKAKDFSGVFDKLANDKIEEAWQEWGKKKNCDISHELSWVDMQRLFIETVARDGEILVRKVKSNDNRFGFSLQFLEADHLDENFNEDRSDGSKIKMGIELDAFNRRVAYHVLIKHPGDYYLTSKHERVSAGDIIHAYIKERPSQSRGIPWMHSAMTRMNMLGGYEEAELVAARISSAKMGFYKTPTGEEYTGDAKTSEGSLVTEVEPGIFEQLPAGYEFQAFDPQHPAGNFDAFMKITLRGIASGLCVSYNSLASDLESVNYSSIRAGSIEERDMWKVFQNWMIENFCNEVFTDWLDMAMLTGAVDLPVSKFDKFNKPKWQVRGWQWVDPLKDAKANIDAINMGLKTRTMVAGEQGYDIEEIFEQLAEEKELAAKYGLEFKAPEKVGAGFPGGEGT